MTEPVDRSMFQYAHEILPEATHDEFAREEFCGTLRKFFTERLWSGNHDVYHGTLLPRFRTQHGRDPADRQEVKDLLNESFYHRAASLVGRCAQELLWDTVGESVERQLPLLREKARVRPDDLGTLDLDPDLPMPRYIDAVDIHVMPGNFHTELCDGDVLSGALYDRGVYYFTYGGTGPQNDLVGVSMATFVRDRFPGLAPKRILDMGCGVGISTLPWKTIFPDAEVFGIDVAAPMLRYGHRRAESLGIEVHFSQQDVVATRFPDGYFDIVTSCLLTHEMPAKLIRQMFRESHRLLADNGVLLFDEFGSRASAPLERQVLSGWFGQNVNEPFIAGQLRLDVPAALIEAGFPPEGFYSSVHQDQMYLKGMTRPDPKGASGPAYTGSVKLA